MANTLRRGARLVAWICAASEAQRRSRRGAVPAAVGDEVEQIAAHGQALHEHGR